MNLEHNNKAYRIDGADEVKKDEKVIESYLGRGSKLKDEN